MPTSAKTPDQQNNRYQPAPGLYLGNLRPPRPAMTAMPAWRLTWGRVLASGAASGVWMGLFVGALLAYFQGNAGALIVGLVAGVLFSVLFAALGYAVQRGRRDFTSASQLVAGRYDVLCQPRNAERAKEVLAELDLGLGSVR
jgi:uncharacterized membrane protein (UPF0136 family)